MKKLIIGILFFVSVTSFAQTVQKRLGIDPVSGRSGYIFNDTVYSVPKVSAFYFNGYGNFVSLRDTVRSYFSATSPITYINGVFALGVVPVANGGTNNSSLSMTNGNLFYADGSKFVSLGVGTAAQTLHGGTVPVWKDTSASGGGSAAGSSTYIQYNSSGSFGASPTLKYSATGQVSTSKFYSSLYISPTPTAQANSDTLVGLELNPYFNLNSKTGVIKQSMKVGNQYINLDSLYNFSIGDGTAATPSTGHLTAIGFGAGKLATSGEYSVMIGRYAGLSATNANRSVFMGVSAGQSATNSNNSNFFGNAAGAGASSANNSNFFGQNSGNGATSAANSNFFGQNSGNGATSASNSNFFGGSSSQAAGAGASSANNSNFFGVSAGFGATSAASSNFFGYLSGIYASGADHSNFFGVAAGAYATNSAYSNFFGANAGLGSTSATYSNFFGYKAGDSTQFKITGTNNIIIGTNITIPTASTSNSMNLGGVLYGTNFYGTTTGNTSKVAQTTGRIGVNVTDPNSTFHVAGSMATDYTSTATSLTATISNSTIEITATGQTITLPTAVGIGGRVYVVKLTASGSATVGTTSSQTIDGSTTYSLSAQYKYVTVQSNNANWIIIGNN